MQHHKNYGNSLEPVAKKYISHNGKLKVIHEVDAKAKIVKTYLYDRYINIHESALKMANLKCSFFPNYVLYWEDGEQVKYYLDDFKPFEVEDLRKW